MYRRCIDNFYLYRQQIYHMSNQRRSINIRVTEILFQALKEQKLNVSDIARVAWNRALVASYKKVPFGEVIEEKEVPLTEEKEAPLSGVAADVISTPVRIAAIETNYKSCFKKYFTSKPGTLCDQCTQREECMLG